MRHGRDVPALDVQHLILNPPDVASREEDRSLQRQGKETAVRAAGQPLQVVHQLRPAYGDGLSHHATILPALVTDSGVQVDSPVAHHVSRRHLAAGLLFLRVTLVVIGQCRLAFDGRGTAQRRAGGVIAGMP